MIVKRKLPHETELRTSRLNLIRQSVQRMRQHKLGKQSGLTDPPEQELPDLTEELRKHAGKID